MKPKILILTAIYSLITCLSASAEEEKLTGELTPIGQILSIEGSKAKFNEYRDIRTGGTGNAAVQAEKGKYYLDFTATDVGRKDQSYDLQGGQWGGFKFDLKYDELPHNLTEQAKTFYSGVGGNILTYTPQPPSTFLPNTNFTTWNTFDYSVQRNTLSGGFKLDVLKPLFFGVSAAREDRRGVMPIGAAGTSPGGISLELPAPVNYRTDTLKFEAGYFKNPLSLTLRYSYGQFQNDNANLNFIDPATANTAATTDSFTLPPDNNYYKLDFKGAMKLPWNSKFNADASYARNESSRTLFNSYVSDSRGSAADPGTAPISNIGIRGRTGILLTNNVFDGKLDIQNYNFVLTTNPFYFLDAKLFYKYYQTYNKSTQITTTDPGPTPVGVTPTILNNEDRLFDYLTYRYGGQLGFKLPMSFYLIGEFTQVHTSRKRDDIPVNDDYIYAATLRWSGVDYMVARVGYEYLYRHAEPTTPADPTSIDNWIRRFDAASKKQDTVKASLDLFPVENLSISLGYRWRQIRYTDTILGLQTWWGNEYHADVDYLLLKRVKLFGYFDFECAKLDQVQRTFTTASAANPALAPTATAFNWTIGETDYNWTYGAGTEVYAIPKKVTFRLQYSFVQSKGFADYTYLMPANLLAAQAPLNTRTQDNIDISNLDNYRLTYYLAKVTYTPIKPLALSFAWAYEEYKYDDAQLNGYSHVPTSSAGALLGFLTGAYANQDYRANIFFASVSYLF
jgi:MtrB/PioB family decaheme-associated outer membrane protein